MAGLAVVVLIAAVWGWSAATKPFPQHEPSPVCVDTKVAAGEWVFRDQVVVSVFNGSRRSRLASSTMSELAERGFVSAATGNAPQPSEATQILSSDPKNPAVVLVKRQFRGAKVVPGDALGPGVSVVVGEKFSSLRRKQVESVRSKADSVICAAPDSGGTQPPG